MSSKGKKNFVNYFKKTKKKSVCITYNVSSEGLVVWVQFDKEHNWDWRHGELILTNLIKNFKLDKIGYKEKPNVLRYKSPYWNPFALTVEYYSPCPKFMRFSFLMSHFKYITTSIIHNFWHISLI